MTQIDVPTEALPAAKLFHGFADSTRLAIVLALLEGQQRVKDLVERLGCSQANVWAHPPLVAISQSKRPTLR